MLWPFASKAIFLLLSELCRIAWIFLAFPTSATTWVLTKNESNIHEVFLVRCLLIYWYGFSNNTNSLNPWAFDRRCTVKGIWRSPWTPHFYTLRSCMLGSSRMITYSLFLQKIIKHMAQFSSCPDKTTAMRNTEPFLQGQLGICFGTSVRR